jgi:AraC-like DNA-binding protein
MGKSGPVRGRLARAPELVRRLGLELELQPDRSLTLNDVAYILDLEPSFCSEVFPTFAGECFCKWIRRIRIEAAKRLLGDTTLSITEIAYRVGYPDITTFGKNFRKEVGVNARSFRYLAMSLTEPPINADLSPLP